MPTNTSTTGCIWLEVANVRFSTDGNVEVQVKGDRTDQTVWWAVTEEACSAFTDHAKAYQLLSETLDKKRVVLAGLTPKNTTTIHCDRILIQHADSISR